MSEGQVKVDAATREERGLIAGMMQFYFYDFSELEPAASDEFELNEEGLFDPYPWLDAYWQEPSRTPLLIRVEGRSVGFALLNGESHSGLTVDRNMGEFFVMRKHRRGGVATAAVRAILAANPGRWEIAIAERNLGAKAFWPRAVAASAGVSDLITLHGDGKLWRGPILSFRVSA